MQDFLAKTSHHPYLLTKIQMEPNQEMETISKGRFHNIDKEKVIRYLMTFPKVDFEYSFEK